MRVTLLLGFLGAGKTTLLTRILKSGVGDDRTAVIVNEFGDAGVDGAIVAGQALDTIELASGCICCSLKGPLLDAIDELAETQHPDRLLIEASGVAQPADLLAALADPAIAQKIELAPVVTLVDASRYARMVASLGRFYAEQVAEADILVVNKTDLASPDAVATVVADVTLRNPQASVICTERCDLDTDAILTGERGPRATITHAAARHHDHINMISNVIDLKSQWHQCDINALFGRLPEGVWRAKGFVRIDGRSHLVQYASGALEISPVDDRDRHYLVVVGQGFDPDAVSDIFKG